MKKKLSCILLSCITLICAFTFASCEKKSEGETEIPPPHVYYIPLPYLTFDCVDDAVSFLRTKDSSYIARGRNRFDNVESFEDGYEKMLQEFDEDGYMLYATSSVAEADKDLYMIPLYNFEDIGVRYEFTWKRTNFRVIISTIDDTKAKDFKVESPRSYMFERMGNTQYVDMQKEVNGQTLNLAVNTKYLFDDYTSIIYFLDSRHYVNVAASAKKVNQEDMLNFIGTLNFEKIYFNEEN